MDLATVIRVKCKGCPKTIEGTPDGWNLCDGCLPAPDGDKWPHTTCGEAGSYCDDDCHSHEHVDMLDGSVICYKVCENHRCDKPFRGDGDFCPDHSMPCLECEERACICQPRSIKEAPR